MDNVMFFHRILTRYAGLLIAIRFLSAAEATPVVSDTSGTESPMTIIAETDGPDSGTVRFALFDRRMADNWGGRVLMAAELPVNGRKIVWKTAPVTNGAYALAVFHDYNGNDELDKNFFGKPVEAYGFSNNIRHLIGPPCIREATFLFDTTSRIIVVKLR